jgi:hypothetical protein
VCAFSFFIFLLSLSPSPLSLSPSSYLLDTAVCHWSKLGQMSDRANTEWPKKNVYTLYSSI